MKKLLSFLALGFLLTACSSMTIPSSEIVDSAGKTITKTAATVGDASTYRTHEKYEAWKTGYTEYSKAYASSGFSMNYQQVTLQDGSKTYLPVIAFKQPPQFVAPADLTPHPVWNTVNNVVNNVTPWAFGSWAATAIVDGFTELGTKPTTAIYGPVQNSLNNSNEDQIITTPNSNPNPNPEE